MLKGYLDLVFQKGVAYQFPQDDDGSGVAEGLLRGDAALVLNTSDTSPERDQELFGDTLAGIWRDCVFRPCGVANVQRRVFAPVVPVAPGSSGKRGWTRWTRRWPHSSGKTGWLAAVEVPPP